MERFSAFLFIKHYNKKKQKKKLGIFLKPYHRKTIYKKIKERKKGKKKKEHKLWFYYMTKLRINHDVQNQNPFFPTLSIQQQMHSIDFRTTLEFFLIYFTFFTFFFPFFFYIVSEFFIVSCLPYWDFMYKIVSKALYKMM